MNEAQKKMKKYTNAVERRLNLPREIRARVMSDFISSISARRESGMTDEEIYAELGTPKEAARAMNEQMKDYTYRKSPWRFVFLAAAVYGLYQFLTFLMGKLLLLFFMMGNALCTENGAASIGIIGGADGPTAIFVTTPPWYRNLIWIAALVLGILGYLRLRKCKK